MASVYDLKPAFQKLLRPLVRCLARLGITANHVTLAALLGSLGFGLLIAVRPRSQWPLLLMPLALLMRMALNAIDGMLAREFAMKSRLGALLNELSDVISDSAMYLPLALVPGVSTKWVVFVVVLALLSEMTGVVAVQIGAPRRYDGPMGKSDRALVIGFGCLLLGLGLLSPAGFNYFLILASALLVVTIFNRARRALAESA